MRNDLAEAVRRGARAMVQSLGAAEIFLMVPSPPVQGDSGEELGLRAPAFQRRPLRPVAVHREGQAAEVTVAADDLETFLGVRDPGAVETAMQGVLFVQVGDQRYLLTATEVTVAMGHACLYRLLLHMPPAEVV